MRQQNRVHNTVALLEHCLLLLVQNLDGRQHHHRGGATVNFPRSGNVPAERIRERVEPALGQQDVTLNEDVVRTPPLTLGVSPVGTVVGARLHTMDDLVFLVGVLAGHL